MSKRQHRPRTSRPAPTRSSSVSPPQLVRIEKPIYGGAFLARAAGKATFVPLALPGEQTRIRIVDDKRGYATAEVEEILEGSPQRIPPACPHFGVCGGCHYQHAKYPAQLTYKQQILRETLERAGVVPPEDIAVLAGEPWAYRNRIRLAFDARENPGYRGRRSHAIIPIAACPIAAPLLVRAALAAGKIVDELPAKVRVTEISLFCDPDETALLAGITVAGGQRASLEDFARVLAGRIPELLGVEFAAEAANGAPPRSLAKWGADSLIYRASAFDYRVDQGAFFQVNRWLVDALIERVTASTHDVSAHSNRQAWDLFSGVGLFARALAVRFKCVAAVESAPASTAALAHNLRDTGASVVKSTVIDFLRRGGTCERPDLIVVDPPRAGLGPETTALLSEVSAPEMVYVSCDPATMARDLRVFLSAGYSVEHITLADLFPQTLHLETVVRLGRARC